jgi:hypothetical protein
MASFGGHGDTIAAMSINRSVSLSKQSGARTQVGGERLTPTFAGTEGARRTTRFVSSRYDFPANWQRSGAGEHGGEFLGDLPARTL